MSVPFHQPFFDGREAEAAAEAVRRGEVVGGGRHLKNVESLLRERFSVNHFLTTTSCTHALELAFMTLDLGPGDEVLVPTYTFSSTATAVLRQGAKVVVCDVREKDLNLDVADAAGRITPRTKAVVPVHYAGYPVAMEEVQELAREHGLFVVEDAAQAVDSFYKGRALGTWGDLGCYSFHGTKSVGCGEGGALATQNPELAKRAEILREKGTDRARFLRGETDKYTWRDQGSSFIPSDVMMAILEVQVRKMDEIRRKREALFSRYMERLAPLEKAGKILLPHPSAETQLNYHMFYVLLETESVLLRTLDALKKEGIGACRHYYPLDASPYGRTLCPPDHKPLPQAKRATERLLRLPFFTAMTEDQLDSVVEHFQRALR